MGAIRNLASRTLLGAALAGFVASVPTARAVSGTEAVEPPTVATAPALVRSILALDCAQLADGESVRVLAHAPAPRILLLQGSFAPVSMEPFAEFLAGMGYPESRLRNPADGGLSYSSFGDSLQLAGAIAWYYEREGLMPMLIGHSQGGMMVVRVLYEFLGTFHDAIPIWNPLRGEPSGRTTIEDPFNHATRPAVGLTVNYAAAIATGTWPRIVLGQWDMVTKVHRIPDTVVDFTGFSIPWDPIAGTFAHPEPYEAIGTAAVRNVILPTATSHVGIPNAGALARQPVTRAWIDAYDPDHPAVPPEGAGIETANLIHAADIWYSVKRHWCQSAQQLLRARGGV